MVGLRSDAGSMAEGNGRPRRGAGETGLSRHAGRACSAGSGAHPVAGGIAEFFLRPFCAIPAGIGFALGKRRGDGWGRETPMLDRTDEVSNTPEKWLAQ